MCCAQYSPVHSSVWQKWEKLQWLCYLTKGFFLMNHYKLLVFHFFPPIIYWHHLCVYGGFFLSYFPFWILSMWDWGFCLVLICWASVCWLLWSLNSHGIFEFWFLFLSTCHRFLFQWFVVLEKLVSSVLCFASVCYSSPVFPSLCPLCLVHVLVSSHVSSFTVSYASPVPAAFSLKLNFSLFFPCLQNVVPLNEFIHVPYLSFMFHCKGDCCSFSVFISISLMIQCFIVTTCVDYAHLCLVPHASLISS